MKLKATFFSFLIIFLIKCSWSSAGEEASGYFGEDACLTRVPGAASRFTRIDDETPPPFEIKLSASEYDLERRRAPITVSIRSILPEVKIGGFVLQAVLLDQELNKPLGVWTSHSDKVVKTLDCSGFKDTLVEQDVHDSKSAEFQWEITEPSQVDEKSSIIFIATVTTADNTIYTNVNSEPVKIIRQTVSLIKADSKLEQALDSVKPVVKSKAKRDITKQFEISTSQCGSRKSCYVSLKTCDVTPRDCRFVLSWDYDGSLINFELIALTGLWTGVVISKDQYLGDDNLIVCQKELYSDRVTVDHYYKIANSSDMIKLLAPEDNLQKQYGSFIYEPSTNTSYIHCRFSRPKTSDNKLVADLSKPHYIYVEQGASGEQIMNKLDQRFHPSDTMIEFGNSVYVPTSPRSWLIKVHAILGIVAWIFLGSIGILLARYYKPMWPNHVLFSFRAWFSFHRVIMVFVTLLTLLCLLFALIELDWKWSVDGNDLLHAILGIIVVICSLLNPILGFFRPKPDKCMRCFFFWCHWLIGTVAYCLAVPTIFIGMDLSKSDLPNWCAWLLFAWVIFHIIVEIILEVHYCCTFYRLQGNYNEYNYDYDKTRKLQKKNKNPPGYRWKPTLLFIYAIVTAIVVSALIIAVVLFDL